jgi:hypothetical protein
MQTYQAVGNREDLLDIITNIAPTETPMLSDFAQDSANAVFHEWLTDDLATAATNAQIEGADYTYARRPVRTRTGNFIQSFVTSVEVTDLQRVVTTAGMEDEYAYQMEKAMKEQARDYEFAIASAQTGTSGASGTARQMVGIQTWITTNVSTAGANRALTETIYNDNLQAIWANGGKPDTSYVFGAQKRVISGFTGGNTKNVNAADKKIVNSVGYYDSDFGGMEIKLDRYVDSHMVLNLTPSLFKTSWLRKTKHTDVAKTSSSTKGVIEADFTLTSLQEKGSGKILNLT